MVSPDGHFTFLVIGVWLCFQSRMQAKARFDHTVLAHDPHSTAYWPRTCTEIPQTARTKFERAVFFIDFPNCQTRIFLTERFFNRTQNPLFSIFGKSLSKYIP